ncbi:hypothetical protein RHGRI_002969 [Rhododendron griersonianum]|uniref:Tetrapyrrole biosynthesis glutamyl-tRNA reductase dimerisation domain-containing protein n=1 Tax=Rhododendron griersonianum TaxID=479676 RepID=A0AAV6LSA2_9ERIC|nr:hypothetical protein RHGRI_002969 [Rhododendron griersonianum]
MVVLASPLCDPVWQSGVANTRTRRLAPVASAATIATKPKPNTAQQLSIGPTIGSLVDQVLFKDQHVVIGDERAFRRSESGKEVGILMERLERVAEGMREMELEKLMGRVRGQISDEERVLVERMSREIVSEFMEKPIQSENGEWARMSIVALKTIFELDYYGSNCFESMRLAVLA